METLPQVGWESSAKIDIGKKGIAGQKRDSGNFSKIKPLKITLAGRVILS